MDPLDVSWQLNVYSFVLWGGALFALSLAVATWRRRRLPGALPAVVLMLALAEWALMAGLSLAYPQPELKNLLVEFQYLGVLAVPAAWLVFVLEYTQRRRWLVPPILALLAVEPFLFLLLLATNGLHGLVYSGVALVELGGFSAVQWELGPAFWGHAIYSYLLLLLAAHLLVRSFIRFPALYRRQILLLSVAVLAPWLGNLVYLFGMTGGFDVTPLGFLITGVCMTGAFYRYHLLDTPRVTHLNLLENLSDGVIVLDTRDRIVYLNQAARRLPGKLGSDLIGRRLAELRTTWAGAIIRFSREAVAHETITIGSAGERSVYDVRLSELRDARQRPAGRLIAMRDITDRVRVEEALRAREYFLASLNGMTEAALQTSDFQTMGQILADRLGELFAADGCYLLFWDETQQRPRPVAARGVDQEEYRSREVELGELAFVAELLAQQRPLVVEDTLDLGYLVEQRRGLFAGRSLLGLPLVADNRKLGAVILASREQRIFQGDEILWAEQISRHLALTVAKVRILESERFARERTEALYQFTSSLLVHETLDGILNTMAQQMSKLLFAHLVLLMTFDEEKQLLAWAKGGAGAGDIEEIPFSQLLQGPVGWAIQERQGTLSLRGRPDPRDTEATHHWRWKAGLGSLMIAPLRYRGRIFGAVMAAHASDGPDFTEHDLALLTAISNQGAVVIDNLWLYEQTAQLKIFNENIVRSVGEIILLEDAHGKFTFVNPAVEEMLGYRPKALLGRQRTDLFLEPGRADSRRNPLRHQPGEVVRYETTILHRDGRKVPVIVSERPLWQDGRYVGTLAAVTDITERKRVEEERERLIEDLDAFAHTVAHDLKSPLTLIIGASRLLQKNIGPDNRSLHYLTESVVRGGEKMSNIIDELLLLSSVRKKESVEFAPLRMSRIIAEALERLQLLIEEHEATIRQPATWPSALGYAPWVEEVWVNYVSNAVKYGGSPPVIELGAEHDNDGQVRFWVRDNGRGLTPEEQAMLFTPFTRLGQIDVSGHGLGLSIVQRIVHRLNGQVQVESTLGQGSEFSFTLPDVADGSGSAARD